MRPEALRAEIARCPRARAAPDRGRRERRHDADGRVRSARGDCRHLRSRGAVAARRRRARRLGRAQPRARASARRDRPRRLGRLGPAQDAARSPRSAPCSRTRARVTPTARSPSRPSTSSERRRGRREHGHPHARVHAPAARARRLPRLRDGRRRRASASTSSGSGSSAASSPGWCAESGDFELALEPECNIVCFRHAVPRGRGLRRPPGAHPRRRQRERPLLRRADEAARRHLAALRAHEPGDRAQRPLVRACCAGATAPPRLSARRRARRAPAAPAARRARARARRS